MLDFVEGLVKGQQMLFGGVFRFVGFRMNQFQLHLQGRIAQKTGELGLRVDLGGHEIEQQDFQRTDVLGDGTRLGHNENIFFGKSLYCRQLVGNLDGHVGFLRGFSDFCKSLLDILDQICRGF